MVLSELWICRETAASCLVQQGESKMCYMESPIGSGLQPLNALRLFHRILRFHKLIPGGHLELLHPWPGQTPPLDSGGMTG